MHSKLEKYSKTFQRAQKQPKGLKSPTYPDVVASGDHVPELVFAAGSGAQVVADGLVPLPPGPPGVVEHDVLVRGGDLNTPQASGFLRPSQRNKVLSSSIKGQSVYSDHVESTQTESSSEHT